MEMALLAPHRVRRLILVCTRDIPVAEFHEAARALRAGAPLDVEATITRWFTAAEIADEGPVIQDVRRRLAAVSSSAYATTLEALATYDRGAELAQIRSPATLLCGRQDLGCTPEVMSTLAADLPRCPPADRGRVGSHVSVRPARRLRGAVAERRGMRRWRQIDSTAAPGPVYTDA